MDTEESLSKWRTIQGDPGNEGEEMSAVSKFNGSKVDGELMDAMEGDAAVPLRPGSAVPLRTDSITSELNESENSGPNGEASETMPLRTEEQSSQTGSLPPRISTSKKKGPLGQSLCKLIPETPEACDNPGRKLIPETPEACDNPGRKKWRFLQQVVMSPNSPLLTLDDDCDANIRENDVFDFEKLKAMSSQEQAVVLRNIISNGHTQLARQVIKLFPSVLHVQGGNLFSALYTTPKHLRAQLAQMLIAEGADVNDLRRTPEQRDRGEDPEYPERPIHVAAKCGLAEIVLLMLEGGADVNAVGGAAKSTPLHEALEEGYEMLALELMEAGADISIRDAKGRTPAFHAVHQGNTLACEELERRGADLTVVDASGTTLLHLACERPRDAMAWHLINRLISTRRSNMLDRADTDNRAPLLEASRRGHYHVAEMLLRKNAMVDRRVYSTGRTALMEACGSGQLDVVQLLLSYRANVRQADIMGRTPLHFICDFAHDKIGGVEQEVRATAIIDQMVKMGAKVDAVDLERRTPLHQACRTGLTKCVLLLLELGADSQAKDARDETALEQAAASGRLDVMLRLMDGEIRMDPERRANLLRRCCKCSVEKIRPVDADLLEVLSDLRYPLHWAILIFRHFELLSRDVAYAVSRNHYTAMAAAFGAFSVSLLELCRDNEEEAEVLFWRDGADVDTVLDLAVACAHKDFVAHRASQLMLDVQWAGSEHRRNVRMVLLYVVFAFVYPIALVVERFLPHQTWFTLMGNDAGPHDDAQDSRRLSSPRANAPSTIPTLDKNHASRRGNSEGGNGGPKGAPHLVGISFLAGELQEQQDGSLCAVISTFYSTPKIKFMGGLLSNAAFLAQLGNLVKEDVRPVFTWTECLVAIWVAGLFVNFLYATYLERRSMMSNLWSYADVAMFALFLIYFIIQASYYLGPLELMIRKMLADMVRFFFILVVFIVAFALGITKIFQRDDSSASEVDHSFMGNVEQLYWALFGLIELGDFAGQDKSTENHARVLLALYCLMAVIVLINLLIAMLASTYEFIHSNSDVEWKYTKALLLRQMRSMSPWPVPLNLIHYLLQIPTIIVSLTQRNVKVQPVLTRNQSWRLMKEAKAKELSHRLMRLYLAQTGGSGDEDRGGSRPCIRPSDVSEPSQGHGLGHGQGGTPTSSGGPRHQSRGPTGSRSGLSRTMSQGPAGNGLLGNTQLDGAYAELERLTETLASQQFSEYGMGGSPAPGVDPLSPASQARQSQILPIGANNRGVPLTPQQQAVQLAMVLLKGQVGAPNPRSSINDMDMTHNNKQHQERMAKARKLAERNMAKKAQPQLL
eukprot:jgi/Mesvir1/19320/Mv10384-RA.3